MKSKIFFGSALVVGAAVCGVQASAASYTIRWIQIHDPIIIADRAAKDFAQRIEKATNGDIHVEVLTKSQYEKQTGRTMSNIGVMREVDAGKGEMCQIYTHALAHFHRRLLTLGLPYIFRDYAHAEAVIEGPLGRSLLGPFTAPTNLRALGITYSGGFGIISSKGFAVRTPADLKGMRMLLSRAPYFSSVRTGLDVEPVVSSPDSFVPLARSGLVDAAETTMACFDMYGDSREADTIADTGHFLLTSMVVVNEKFYQSLPPKYRELIAREAFDTSRRERQASIDANAESRRKMLAKGVKINILTNEEKALFEKALHRQYKMKGLSQDFIQEIRAVGLHDGAKP